MTILEVRLAVMACGMFQADCDGVRITLILTGSASASMWLSITSIVRWPCTIDLSDDEQLEWVMFNWALDLDKLENVVLGDEVLESPRYV